MFAVAPLRNAQVVIDLSQFRNVMLLAGVAAHFYNFAKIKLHTVPSDTACQDFIPSSFLGYRPSLPHYLTFILSLSFSPSLPLLLKYS